MQQQAIPLQAASTQVQPINVIEQARQIADKVNRWLDQKSQFFSIISEMTVTRRLVIRVNLVTICLLTTAIAVEQAPLTATAALVAAAWLTRRLSAPASPGSPGSHAPVSEDSSSVPQHSPSTK